MAALTNTERTRRKGLLKKFGIWLKQESMTQRQAAHELGIYHGYLSNLTTGKQIASRDVCDKISKMMRPEHEEIEEWLPVREGQMVHMVRQPSRPKKRRAQPTWSVLTYEEIDSWRIKQGLTKIAMAEMIGITNATYHNWRTGTSIPNERRQQRIKTLMERDVPRHPKTGRRALTQSELEATVKIVRGSIHAGMTPGELVDVLGAVIQGLTT